MPPEELQEHDGMVKRGDVVEWQVPKLTREMADKLRAATRAEHTSLFPPTFATVFRKAEFGWLNYMEVNMRNLLHTEQEYEYLSPFEVGDEPLVRTRVENVRERSGMRFVTLVSEVTCGGKMRVLARSAFVVREGDKA